MSSPLNAKKKNVGTCWIALFMINLNLTIVWRKDWFSEHYTKIHVFIVIWALVPAIGIIASKGVRNVGFFCLFDVDHAWWFLVFFGVSGWPGVTITMVTVIAIVRMLLSAPNQRIKQRMTNSGRTSSNTCPSHQQTGGVILELKASPLPRNSENVTTSKEESMVTPIKSQNMTNSLADLVTSTAQSQAVNVASKLKEHRDKVWGLLIKSWRSIAISLALVMMYGGFWTFNLVAVMMMKGVGTDTPWVRNWYACVLQGNSREVCASLAVSFTPPVGFMIYANVAVNLIGFSSFLIFGLGMIDDWKQLLGLKK
ncbi:hypothetical protein BC830DRAFT_1087011 [Chytriomyces sp. MP71]|nr:hypothetical protein BC830DRAFT_1087011 [Chytriomyces sp. MP71]